MVRRGSTVRVRQRASQKRRKTPHSTSCSTCTACNLIGYGALSGTLGVSTSVEHPDPKRGSLHYESRAAALLGAIGRFSPCLAVTGRYAFGQEILSAILSAPETTSGLPKEGSASRSEASRSDPKTGSGYWRWFTSVAAFGSVAALVAAYSSPSNSTRDFSSGRVHPSASQPELRLSRVAGAVD